ncbi:hypothetical protein N7535_002379 [Penicillium sp. DV-2018c]|nr:hypothetical protein N7535_002379 [Penicillium sp. DV-2018c]
MGFRSASPSATPSGAAGQLAGAPTGDLAPERQTARGHAMGPAGRAACLRGRRPRPARAISPRGFTLPGPPSSDQPWLPTSPRNAPHRP